MLPLKNKSADAVTAAAYAAVAGCAGRPGVMSDKSKTPAETTAVQQANALLRAAYAKLPEGSTLADVLAKMVELAPPFKAETAKALAALNALATSAGTGGDAAAAAAPTAVVTTTAVVTPTAAAPTAAAPTAAAPTAAAPTAAVTTAAAAVPIFDAKMLDRIKAALPKKFICNLADLYQVIGALVCGAEPAVLIGYTLKLVAKARMTLFPAMIRGILKELGVLVQIDTVVAECDAGVAAGKYRSTEVFIRGNKLIAYGLKLSDRSRSSAPRSSGGGSYARPRDTTAGSGGGGAENAAISAENEAINAENAAIEDAITGPIGAVTLPDGPLDHLATDPDPSDDDDDINAQLFGSSTNAFAFPDTVSDAASGGGADAAASQ